MGALSGLPNVGKVLEQNLNQIGIYTPEALRAAGAREAFIRIRLEVDAGACLQMLYGLQGAVEGVRDTLLPAGTKAELKRFFDAL